jgi:hypothetical protein
MNMREFDIEALVADLKPVRTVRSRHGMALVMGATAAAIGWVGLWYGIRDDILAGAPEPLVILRGGALLLLGLATSLAVTAAAKPSVGQRHEGWLWALAAALLFPVAALLPPDQRPLRFGHWRRVDRLAEAGCPDRC